MLGMQAITDTARIFELELELVTNLSIIYQLA